LWRKRLAGVKLHREVKPLSDALSSQRLSLRQLLLSDRMREGEQNHFIFSLPVLLNQATGSLFFLSLVFSAAKNE